MLNDRAKIVSNNLFILQLRWFFFCCYANNAIKLNFSSESDFIFRFRSLLSAAACDRIEVSEFEFRQITEARQARAQRTQYIYLIEHV